MTQVRATFNDQSKGEKPSFARELHGLSPLFLPPALRSATFGVAQMIRWAFAGENYRKTQ